MLVNLILILKFCLLFVFRQNKCYFFNRLAVSPDKSNAVHVQSTIIDSYSGFVLELDFRVG